MSKFTRQMVEWTGDFGKEYTDRNALTFFDIPFKNGFFDLVFTNLRLVREEHFKYLDSDKMDVMFLLRKEK